MGTKNGRYLAYESRLRAMAIHSLERATTRPLIEVYNYVKNDPVLWEMWKNKVHGMTEIPPYEA